MAKQAIYKTVQFLRAIWFNATGLTGSIFFATTFLNACRLFITFGLATLQGYAYSNTAWFARQQLPEWAF